MLHGCGGFFEVGCADEAKVLTGEEGAQVRGDLRRALGLQRAAAVDGGLQVAQEGDTGGTALDVFAHFVAGFGLDAIVEVFREIGEEVAAGVGAAGARRMSASVFARRGLAHALQLLADGEAGAMQADAHGAGLEIEDLRDLLGGELFHVVQDKDEAQRRGDFEDGAMELVVGFGAEDVFLWGACGVGEKVGELVAVGHQLVEREGAGAGVGGLFAHAPAAIAGDGVEPDGEGAGLVDFGQVGERAIEDFLHGVLGVFGMAADFHAEGVDGVLEEAEGLFDRFGRAFFEQLGSADEVGSHRQRAWGKYS